MKKLFENLLFTVFFGFGLFVFLFVYQAHGFRPTQNLDDRKHNLDTLADKSNNLVDLIRETQGLRVQGTTVPAVTESGSGNIMLPGITTDDTIVGALVLSSANVTYASTITLTVTDENNDTHQLGVISKIPGAMGNNITIAITAHSSGTTYAPLTVNTTGYNIQVKLSSHAGQYEANYSSINAIVAAIRAHTAANSLVHVYAVGTGTGVPSALSQTNLTAGAGTIQGAHWLPVDGSSITANGTVHTTTSAAVSNNDWLLWFWYDRDIVPLNGIRK